MSTPQTGPEIECAAHHQLMPDDIYVAVLGMTGAGKSTFIARCTDTRAPLTGHGLESCTTGVTIHSMMHNGRKVHLIDTPGFDDSRRSDSDILQELSFWLLWAYKDAEIRLSGLVYLHRITDDRLQGSALRGLNVFKRLCGSVNYPGVVLATTFWDSEDPQIGQMRQRELADTERFWGELRLGGAQVCGLTAGKTSSSAILNHIIANDRRLVLQLQAEMAVENKTVQETAAGVLLAQEWRIDVENLETNIAITKVEHEDAIAEHDEQRATLLRDELQDFSRKIEEKSQAIRNLQISTEALNKEYHERIRKDHEKLLDFSKRIDQRLKAKRRQIAESKRNGQSRESIAALLSHMKTIEEERAAIENAKQTRLAYSSLAWDRANTVAAIVSVGVAMIPLIACTVM